MVKDILKTAGQLYRRRRFSQIVRLLEGQVFRFREDKRFYRLLGLACLRTGDIGGASSYLKRARQLDPEDTTVLLGLAALEIRQSRAEEALKIWLEVLDLDPRNHTAIQGLNLIRKGTDVRGLNDWIGKGRLLPPIPFNPAPLLIILGLCLSALVIAFSLLYLKARGREAEGTRPELNALELEGTQSALTSPGGAFTIILTDQEVKKAFAQAKSHLMKYRDNLAMKEINRILLSNASGPVKEKARLLKVFITPPDFANLKDQMTFQEVRRQPALYEDCFVAWKGKTANVRVSAERIDFDLLVGYQEERELLGVVPVSLKFSVDLENGVPVEVLAQIVALPPLEKQPPPPVPLNARREVFGLKGISIHRLYGP